MVNKIEIKKVQWHKQNWNSALKKRFKDTNKIEKTLINNINIYQKNFSHSAYNITLFTYA